MVIERVFAQMSVADLGTALVWYERLLGRPADATPMEGLAEWHFQGTGGIQLFRDGERAGSATLTIAVDDLAAYAAAVAGRGIPVGAITTSEKARFVAITDPDGNTITLAEALGVG